MSELIKLNLGAGGFNRSGWLNVDIVEAHKPDLVDDVSSLATIEPGTVDEIFAGHILEHVEDIGDTLIRWFEVLKPGGIITAVVPDMIATFDLWSSASVFPVLNTNPVVGLTAVTTGFYSYGQYKAAVAADPDAARAQRHRRVFDPSMLKLALTAAGFTLVTRIYKHPCMVADCYEASWQVAMSAVKPISDNAISEAIADILQRFNAPDLDTLETNAKYESGLALTGAAR